MFDDIAMAVGFLADAVSLAVGGLALWGLIYKRKHLSHFLHGLGSLYLHHSAHRMDATLRKLESLSWGSKAHQPKIRALVSHLSSQLKPFVKDHATARLAYDQANGMVQRPAEFTESNLQQLIAELHDFLDTTMYGEPRNTTTPNNLPPEQANMQH